MRTNDPLLLLTIAAVAAVVVGARRGRAPWARAYGLLLKLGLLTVVVTMLLQVLLGARYPGHTLVTPARRPRCRTGSAASRSAARSPVSRCSTRSPPGCDWPC